MTIERKVGMGIAGQSSGDGPTDVADVFSTFLYTPATSNSNVPIVNGIDLAGEGGMVWIKQRDTDRYPVIVDTERGGNKVLHPHENYAGYTQVIVQSFNSNGFTTGTSSFVSVADEDTVAWTFRKKEKFFDVVTYTGNGANRTIAHSLGGDVGMMFIRQTNATNDWIVYVKSLGNDKLMYLNLTNSIGNDPTGVMWNTTTPTNDLFSIGTQGAVNTNGATYVAYLFADNSSEDAEDQMIKCGSYTGNGTVGRTLDLGWEPQFILLKRTDSADNWFIFDTTREQTTGISAYIRNLRHEEGRGFYYIPPNPTGITFNAANGGAFNTNNAKYMYMAIRAPMMVKPEAATDVFSVKSYTGNGATQTLDAAFGPVDMAIVKNKESGVGMQPDITTRLTHAELYTDSSTEEGSRNFVTFDSNSLVLPAQNNSNTSNIPFSLFSWKRAKGYMDCVAYSGTGSARTQTHSLGVVPEMIWVKSRANSKNWAVYHPSSHAAGNTLFLNLDNGGSGVGGFQSTAVSDTTFNVDTAEETNSSGWTYVAYLFATLAGISKVGSYTGNGYNQTINCGFSAGARFILIKRIGATGDWYLWDSARGIVAGNDPHFSLNTDAEQITSNDSIDPANSGFIVNQVSATNINVSSGTYIFYAIA